MELPSYGSVGRRDLESQLSKSNISSRQHSLWWNVTIDLPLFVIVLVLLGIYELGVIPSHKAGFFCNDPALSYPFTGDTVSMGLLVSTIIIGPFVIMLVTEAIFIDSDYSCRGKIISAFKTTCWLYRSYVYGMFFNIVIIQAMKGLTGNPRPTFFDICEPDTARTCTGSEFVTTFECTSTRYSKWFQMDSYHSFPSGHTSLSVYGGLFMAWYLQRRAFDWRHRTVFLVPVLQLLCITYAAVCSLTRITDHRHHWWDVLTGAVVAVFSLLYAVLVLCKNFSYANSKSSNYAAGENQQSTVTLLYDGQRQENVS